MIQVISTPKFLPFFCLSQENNQRGPGSDSRWHHRESYEHQPDDGAAGSAERGDRDITRLVKETLTHLKPSIQFSCTSVENSLLFEATSSRTIQETNDEFKTMTGTIQLGRKLITKYNRRELTDKLLIFLALALFLATVLYILKKRLFPFL